MLIEFRIEEQFDWLLDWKRKMSNLD